MNFREDTPIVGSVIRIYYPGNIVEARIESRLLNPEAELEEVLLSDGRVLRRDALSKKKWRMWLNNDGIGQEESIKINQLTMVR